MSNRDDKEYLADIIEAIKRIKDYTNSCTYDEFIKDYKTQDAVLRNLEILGEAVKNISEDIRNKYPNIPWKEMAGTRDRLIHDYFGVNIDIVWGIIDNELDAVCKGIKSIIDK